MPKAVWFLLPLALAKSAAGRTKGRPRCVLNVSEPQISEPPPPRGMDPGLVCLTCIFPVFPPSISDFSIASRPEMTFWWKLHVGKYVVMGPKGDHQTHLAFLGRSGATELWIGGCGLVWIFGCLNLWVFRVDKPPPEPGSKRPIGKLIVGFGGARPCQVPGDLSSILRTSNGFCEFFRVFCAALCSCPPLPPSPPPSLPPLLPLSLPPLPPSLPSSLPPSPCLPAFLLLGPCFWRFLNCLYRFNLPLHGGHFDSCMGRPFPPLVALQCRSPFHFLSTGCSFRRSQALDNCKPIMVVVGTHFTFLLSGLVGLKIQPLNC